MTEKRTVQCQSCKAVTVFDPGARRPELRVLRLARARRLQGDQGADPAAEPAAVQGEPGPGPRADRASGMRASGWRRTPSRAARSSIGSTASTSRTGRSTRRPSARGTRTPATTTTRPRPQDNGRTETRQVRHVRWEPASGVVEHFFDDEPVPGTQGIPRVAAQAGRAVSDQRARALHDRLPVGVCRRALSGRAVRRGPAVAGSDDERSCRRWRRRRFRATPTATCRSIRRSRSETFKHILVPVWLLTYNYGAKPFQLVVNGYTGQMAGEYPKSAWKIALLVLLALIVRDDLPLPQD